MITNVSQIAAEVLERVFRENPDPFDTGVFGPRMSYRERLHRPRRNIYGDPIATITLVRRNIRALGKPRCAPRLPA